VEAGLTRGAKRETPFSERHGSETPERESTLCSPPHALSRSTGEVVVRAGIPPPKKTKRARAAKGQRDRREPQSLRRVVSSSAKKKNTMDSAVAVPLPRHNDSSTEASPPAPAGSGAEAANEAERAEPMDAPNVSTVPEMNRSAAVAKEASPPGYCCIRTCMQSNGFETDNAENGCRSFHKHFLREIRDDVEGAMRALLQTDDRASSVSLAEVSWALVGHGLLCGGNDSWELRANKSSQERRDPNSFCTQSYRWVRRTPLGLRLFLRLSGRPNPSQLVDLPSPADVLEAVYDRSNESFRQRALPVLRRAQHVLARDLRISTNGLARVETKSSGGRKQILSIALETDAILECMTTVLEAASPRIQSWDLLVATNGLPAPTATTQSLPQLHISAFDSMQQQISGFDAQQQITGFDTQPFILDAQIAAARASLQQLEQQRQQFEHQRQRQQLVQNRQTVQWKLLQEQQQLQQQLQPWFQQQLGFVSQPSLAQLVAPPQQPVVPLQDANLVPRVDANLVPRVDANLVSRLDSNFRRLAQPEVPRSFDLSPIAPVPLSIPTAADDPPEGTKRRRSVDDPNPAEPKRAKVPDQAAARIMVELSQSRRHSAPETSFP
jgi:hypothetical protein